MSDDIHIINPFQVAGGSERRCLDLHRLLHPKANVRLWATAEPIPELRDMVPIHRIDEKNGVSPRSGTFIFMGIYQPIGRWYYSARPGRVILIYNTRNVRELIKTWLKLSWCGLRRIDLVYASQALKKATRLQGEVHSSPVNLSRFPLKSRSHRNPSSPFTVGRLSRDILEKHHPDDIPFYKRLAAHGIRIRIMGGMCLAPWLDNVPNIELLPAGAEDAAVFLNSLDCFYYRSSPGFYEAFGRVVIEAMAIGLPVVCGKPGGYEEFISHGETGFLFDSEHDAWEILQTVRNNPEKMEQMAIAARHYLDQLYVREQARQTTYYLEPDFTPDFLLRPISSVGDIINRRFFSGKKSGQ